MALANQPMPCAEGIGRGAECGKHPATLYPRGRRCAACATAAGLGLPAGPTMQHEEAE